MAWCRRFWRMNRLEYSWSTMDQMAQAVGCKHDHKLVDECCPCLPTTKRLQTTRSPRGPPARCCQVPQFGKGFLCPVEPHNVHCQRSKSSATAARGLVFPLYAPIPSSNDPAASGKQR